MDKFKKFIDRLSYDWLPTFWGFAWIITITAFSLGLLINSLKWLLSVVGVL